MKIYNKKEFYELPENTLYVDYEPYVFYDFKIKGKSIRNDEGKYIDFFYCPLLQFKNQDCQDYFQCQLDKYEHVPLNIEYIERDALFNDEDKYAVFDKEDILALINTLKGVLK